MAEFETKSIFLKDPTISLAWREVALSDVAKLLLPFATVGFGDGYQFQCTGTDDNEVFDDALEYLRLQGGGILQIGPGAFSFSDTVRAAFSNLTVMSSPGANITLASGVNAPMFQFGDGVTQYSNIDVSGLRMNGSKASQSVTSGANGSCIYLNYVKNVTLNDLNLTNPRTFGVFLQNTSYFTIQNSYIDSPGGAFNGLAAGDGILVFTGCSIGQVDNVQVNTPYRIGVTVDSSSTHVTYVDLKNCFVNGGDRGYHVELADYCNITNCTTINNTGAVFNPVPTTNETASPAIMVANNTTNIVVTGNKIRGGQGGILTLTSFNDTVANNDISTMAWYGVFFRHESGGATWNTATGNVVSGTTTDGIYVAGAQNNTFSGNTVKSPTGRGIYSVAAAKYNTFVGNTIYGAGSSSIEFNNNGNCQVIGNSIMNSSLNGIRMVRSSYNTICGNRIYNSSQAVTNVSSGIKLETSSATPSTYNVVSGNIIIDDGSNKAKYSIEEAFSTDDFNDIHDNITVGATTGTIRQLGLNSSVHANQNANPMNLQALGSATGATTFNRLNGSVITATLTGNITTTVTNGLALGDKLVLQLTQDGTGGRTVSKPANVRLVGGAFSPSAGAGATDTWSLVWDGTYWNETARSLNIS